MFSDDDIMDAYAYDTRARTAWQPWAEDLRSGMSVVYRGDAAALYQQARRKRLKAAGMTATQVRSQRAWHRRPQRALCACGCGRPKRYGRYLQGHNLGTRAFSRAMALLAPGWSTPGPNARTR